MSTPAALDFGEILRWLDATPLRLHADLMAKARLLLLDTVACVVAGLAEEEPAALAQLRALTAPGGVMWPGGPAMAPASAAFVGAVAACWHEACEGLARAHGRPGLHAIPVAYALGQARKATLGEILEAIVWGYEVGGRAGEAMRIRPGLHVDGTWGLFAATTAAARMIGLDPERTLTALAMAACQIPSSLYAPVAAGRTARNTYAAHAALLAMPLAESAAAGLTAPETAFELAGRALAGDPQKNRWPWAPVGEFMILQSYLKPFAAVRHVHYAASCAIARHTEHRGDTQAITGLTLRTYPEALTYCGNRAPQTPIQAQFSLTHGTAFALRAGTLGPEAYAAAVFADPEQQRLESLIEVESDQTMTGRGATLMVTAGRGAERYDVTSVPGDPDQPLTSDEVRAKARAYMAPSLGDRAADQIMAAILDGDLAAPLDLPRQAL